MSYFKYLNLNYLQALIGKYLVDEITQVQLITSKYANKIVNNVLIFSSQRLNFTQQ